MKDQLLDWELKSLAMHQLESFILKGRYLDQCLAEWERRTGRKYGEEAV